MAVRVNDRPDRTIAPVGAVDRQRRPGGFGRGERVDDDDAGVALDERDVGDVESPHLVDAGDYLEEPLDRIEARLAPQAGMDRVRGVVAAEEGECVGVPRHPAVPGADGAGLRFGDEPAGGVGEVLGVVEGKCVQRRLMERANEIAGLSLDPLSLDGLSRGGLSRGGLGLRGLGGLRHGTTTSLVLEAGPRHAP